MRKALWTAAFMMVFAGAVGAETRPAESRIASVGLFKNGLAVVKRTVTLPGPGTYRISDVPEPVHGTFWVESDAVVETRVTTQEVEVPLRTPGAMDLAEELAGRDVLIHFRDGSIPPARGKVLTAEHATVEETWRRDYEPPRYSYYSSYERRSQRTPRGRFLVLETDKGRVYVDPAMIAYAECEGVPTTVRQRRPVLIFDVKDAERNPATIAVTYLAKGMAWAPSYRVDISDPDTLRIEQKAVVKNELADIEDAEVYLISGFPSMEFAHVTSPLSLRTTWASFFTDLSRRRRRDADAVSNVLTQQAVGYPSAAASVSLTDLAAAALPSGQGPDLHYQSIGRRTLAEGDSLALAVASAGAPYERIVEWIVPDTRDERGRRIRESERRQDPEKYQDAAWDAVCFRNPLPFPMTTAPIMTVANGRFLGQRTSYWANVGEKATVHVTKALSLRTRSVEREEPGERKVIHYARSEYRKSTVAGELSVRNHRNETVKLVIRRRFSGKLVSADGEPECVLREEGIYSVNERNELVWTLSLEPGEEIGLTYQYTVLVWVG